METSIVFQRFIKTTGFILAILVGSTVSIQTAQAGVAAGGWTRSSTVDSTVTNNGNGTWTYAYTVNNTSLQNGGPDAQPILVDWELPWFGDAGIDLMSIVSPTGWAYAIETIGMANSSTGWDGVASWQDPMDPFYAGASSPYTTGTEVLHWYSECFFRFNGDRDGCGGSADGISTGNSLSGFGFVASYDETAAPYQASWIDLPVRTGDPAFPLGGIPNSPSVSGVQTVPEPSLLGLLGIGFVAAMLGRRRRN